MIDWIKMIVPCTHIAPIRDGCFQRVGMDGEVEWSSDKSLTVTGSHDATIRIRTASWMGDRTHIEVDGNIAKFFQGHNLWGSDDLPGLVFEFLRWLAQNHGLTEEPLVSPTEADIAAWIAGDIQLTRTDCTENFLLANQGEVLSWLQSAEQTAHLAHRGRGQLCKGSTLYFGKNSRRSSLKLYAKGIEIRAKGHEQDVILKLPAAVEYANRSLRAELTLRSMELKRLGLDHVRDWMPVDGVPLAVTGQLLRERLGTMTMTTTNALPADAMASIRPALRVTVQAWESGADLRATLPHRTFYKYRKELLPFGIDIAMKRPREVSNIVPLHRVLEAVPAGVPDWAIGTPLFFEPRRVA